MLKRQRPFSTVPPITRFDLVFWQNIVSPHQAPTLRALSSMGHRVTVVASDLISSSRRALGWQVPNVGACRVQILDKNADIREIVSDSSLDAVHVLAGAQVGPLGAKVLAACVGRKKRLGIISESPDIRGVRHLLKLAKYSWDRLRFERHVDFVLAMGERGVNWFQRCGYPEAKIYPYIYTVDGGAAPPPEVDRNTPFRICFVGQLIKRKGIDILLRAVEEGLSECDFQLTIIGSGEMEESLRKLADALGVQSRVEWKGRLPSNEVAAEISNSDVLVLPSREDGWGAVVNEALMLGVPVVCSSACGAQDLIRSEWRGSVFPTENAIALAHELRKWCDFVGRDGSHRSQIQSWAKCISGESTASYLTAVLEHVYCGYARPAPPWLVG